MGFRLYVFSCGTGVAVAAMAWTMLSPMFVATSLGEGTLSCDSVRLRFVGLDSGDGEEGEDLVGRLPGELAGVLVLVPPLLVPALLGELKELEGRSLRGVQGGVDPPRPRPRPRPPPRPRVEVPRTASFGVSTRRVAGPGVVSIGVAAGR